MSGPCHKIESEQLSEAKGNSFLAYFDGDSEDIRTGEFPARTLNRNIRDVLANDNQDRFTKKPYSWAVSASIGSSLVAATSSYYTCALKLMHRAKRIAKPV